MAEQRVSCPMCMNPAIRDGRRIICERCDATYTISKTGPNVLKRGVFDTLVKDMEIVKTRLGITQEQYASVPKADPTHEEQVTAPRNPEPVETADQDDPANW